MKIKNYRTFWWIMGIYALVVPALYISFGYFEEDLLPSKTLLFTYPTMWQYITWAASWFNVVLGVLVVILICNDINFKTQRQQIIDGMSRNQVIWGKFLFILALAAAVTLYTILLGAIIGAIYSTPSNMFHQFEYVGIYFLQTIGYFSFAFFFAVLVRRPALAIVLYIVIIGIDMVLYAPIIMDHNAQFFPTIAISELTPNPFYKQLQIMRAMEAMKNGEVYTEPPNMDMIIRSILASIYIGIFIFVGFFSIKRRDL